MKQNLIELAWMTNKKQLTFFGNIRRKNPKIELCTMCGKSSKTAFRKTKYKTACSSTCRVYRWKKEHGLPLPKRLKVLQEHNL